MRKNATKPMKKRPKENPTTKQTTTPRTKANLKSTTIDVSNTPVTTTTATTSDGEDSMINDNIDNNQLTNKEDLIGEEVRGNVNKQLFPRDSDLTGTTTGNRLNEHERTTMESMMEQTSSMIQQILKHNACKRNWLEQRRERRRQCSMDNNPTETNGIQKGK